MHPSVIKVTAALREAGAGGEVRELPEPAPTAATAAAQLGCDVGAIANSLVFNADGAPLLVLTSGAHRVDTGKVAGLLGVSKVKRADPDFVRRSTGQVIGGVAPVGHPQPLRTLVDRRLAAYGVVWAAAGHVHTVFPTTFTELVEITGGTPADVGTGETAGAAATGAGAAGPDVAGTDVAGTDVAGTDVAGTDVAGTGGLDPAGIPGGR